MVLFCVEIVHTNFDNCISCVTARILYLELFDIAGKASGHETLLQNSSTNTPEERECYEEEVQPHRKTDYKPMIYIIKMCCTIQHK